MTLIDEYLELQEKYEKKYGEKTIVLMEVGSFFEIYGVVNDEIQRGRIYEIADITNLTVSKKNSKTEPVSEKNPLMAGFPNHSFDKWREILLKNEYTIIKIEQDSHGSKDPKRDITEIISPGVNLESVNNTNNTMSIFLEEIKSAKPILYAGISIVDVSTGESTVYQTNSNPDDFKFALDEIFRFIQTFSPTEIILHTVNVSIDYEEILNYLEISHLNIHYNTYSNETYMLQNKFKEAIVKKIFPNTGMITPIEYINMEKMEWALCSFIYLVQFCYEHNENIILKLEKPKIWETQNHLVLSHDTINQLNVIPDKNRINVKGIQSLWDVLDKTSNPVGKRALKEYLLNPIINRVELQKRYDIIESLLKKHHGSYIFYLLKNKLKNICDIERLHRKMAIKLMNPSSFLTLDVSYQAILSIFSIIDEIGNSDLISLLPYNDTIDIFKTYIEDYNSKIKMDKIAGINLTNMKENIFKPGLYTDIDKIQEKIDFYNNYFYILSDRLSNLIGDKQVVDIKYNERDGHYLVTTNSRGIALKREIEKLTNITFSIDGKECTINKSDFEYKSTSGNMKITTKTINDYSQYLISYEQKMMTLCLNQFSQLLQEYYNSYSNVLKEITYFVGYLDFLVCGSIVSLENAYCKPKLSNDEHSFIKATDLRHPIVERLNTNITYVPNDVCLGTDEQNGILLMGTNCVGKSSYMKSIGLAIIMAQCGFYVPAKDFLYSPYKYLFTRISNNDNIFKGQSTFAVEMSELRSILLRANNYSIVLGDELCSGTETTSGISIVTAGVMRLSSKNSSFVFATHLHKLADMDEIRECSNVHIYHMETIYDETKKKLIYDRKLKKGSGNAIYGLEVAKAMDLDASFIETANNIRKKLMGIQETIVKNKKSSYNADIIVEKCKICGGEASDVHHIQEQNTADENNMIGYIHKNNKSNLVTLCNKCHQREHNGDLKIEGYVYTTDGVELKYSENNKVQKRKKKYDDNQIELVKEAYKKTGKFSLAKQLLSVNNSLEISVPMIKKIVNGSY